MWSCRHTKTRFFYSKKVNKFESGALVKWYTHLKKSILDKMYLLMPNFSSKNATLSAVEMKTAQRVNWGQVWKTVSSRADCVLLVMLVQAIKQLNVTQIFWNPNHEKTLHICTGSNFPQNVVENYPQYQIYKPWNGEGLCLKFRVFLLSYKR